MQRPGVGALHETPAEAGPSLRDMLDWAQEHLPPAKRAETPLYLYATAGLRLLPPDKQDQVRLLALRACSRCVALLPHTHSLSLLLRASCGANVCVRDIVHATACAAYRYWIRSVRRVRHAQAQFVMRDVAQCADSVALHAPRPPAAHKTEFMFVDDWCRVISGREEAVFGWVAAQQLFILAADDLDVRRAASSLPPSIAHALTARHECRASWPSARRLA